MSNKPIKPSNQNQAFICYAHEDYNIAEKLSKDLLQAGIPVWMDKKSLIPGQRWKEEIENAVKNSDWFIVLLSSNSVSKKGFIQKELKFAFEILDILPPSEIFLIPARIDECNPTDDRLKEYHWAEFFPSYTNGLSQILKVLSQNTETENNLYEFDNGIINERDQIINLSIEKKASNQTSPIFNQVNL